MGVFFTADLHLGHRNVIKYAGRPFADVTEMDTELIRRWNDTVGDRDTVYLLGDFALCPRPLALAYREKLRGNIFLIKGNHDKDPEAYNFGWVKDLHTVKVPDPDAPEGTQRIVLCHYAMRVWDRSHYGAWQLYGHCVDTQTEILTCEGWQGYQDVLPGTRLPSFNEATGLLEEDVATEVLHFPDYCGGVYHYTSKSVDMRVTAKHRCYLFSRDGRRVEVLPADQAFQKNRVALRRAGTWDRPGLPLSDALIKLWILTAADASVKLSTDLVRIHVWKDRKKAYIRTVLDACQVAFKELVQGDGSSSFNFYLPPELRGYGIKGLDPAILGCSPRQFYAIIEAYGHSDGHFADPGILVYSSKEAEIDLLQALAVQCGYGATKYTRVGHGFSTRPAHQLSVFPASVQVQSKFSQLVQEEQVEREHFWCIRNRNHNFFMRRNGRVHLTGNSHGTLPDNPNARAIDVGVDCWDFRPVSYAQVKARMAQKTWKPVDHHGEDRL